jgi:hypothetical protein
MIDDVTPSTGPQLSGRVFDLQARVREHCLGRKSPEGLAAGLRGIGLDASVDTSAPGGVPLVRVVDGDLSLLFDPVDGALRILDVRRPISLD